MRGAVKHIVLLFVVAVIIILLAIPVLRRMEPHHDVVPPPEPDSTQAVTPPSGEGSRVIDEREGRDLPVTPSGQTEWRTLQAWDGVGPSATDPFRVNSHTWRITWETQVLPKLGAGAFQIMVYQDGALKSVAATTTKTDLGSTMLAGPGTFTLSINTLQKWKVKIEEKG